MKEKDDILNKYSFKKHSLHFNQLANMYDRAIILEMALEEALVTKPSKKLNNDLLGAVSGSLRDTIAMEAMNAEIIAWNAEMSEEYRVGLLEDMNKRYGNIKINDCLAKMSYEMADAMLKVRNDR